jgi:hypothetical protein
MALYNAKNSGRNKTVLAIYKIIDQKRSPMMDKFSRREFFYLSASLSVIFPLHAYAMNGENNKPKNDYPNTLLLLKQAFNTEMIAHEHYLGYVEKALAEKYPNISYMFYAFSFSEKIHADNYKNIISTEVSPFL